jgi:glycosyltransferase involved in cell wall biosynthesis
MSRVLLVSASSRLGGAERSLVELARALACLPPHRQAGGKHELHAVVSGKGELFDILSGALGGRIETVSMPRLQRTVNPLRLAGYIASVARASKAIANVVRERGIDLVHANGVLAQVYAGRAAARSGVPCVFHARDMVSLGSVAERAMREPERIVAVSRAVRDHLVREGAPEERVSLVLNGVVEWPARDAPSREETRRSLGLDPSAFVVGSAGVFVPWKRHEDFVRAFADLCEMEMADLSRSALKGRQVRRGGGGSSSEQGVVDLSRLVPARAVLFGADIFEEHSRHEFELRKLADELVGERLVFAGWREELQRDLRALDCFVSASEREPFGRVIVEAMLAGVAVVATDSGARREVVLDGETGILVPQGDVGALAVAMDQLRRDPERRRAMGEAGRRRAREEFSIDRAAREVEAVWDEALGPALRSRTAKEGGDAGGAEA